MGDNYIPSLKKPKERHQPPPKVTIPDMLTIADKLCKETGHYPSFGEVQTAIELGKINPDDYLGGVSNDKRRTKRGVAKQKAGCSHHE